jgi:hypothetical protein
VAAVSTKEIEMLFALRPAAPYFASLYSVAFKSVVLRSFAFLCLAVLLALLLPLGSASAQGSFTTTKPFLLTLDKSHNFTLMGIAVVYKPINGTLTSGFLTLSGKPVSHSLTIFNNIHLSFSPTQNGKPTVTDTFSHGVVTSLGSNLYCLASVGRNANGSSFVLYGGFVKSASASTSSVPPAASPSVKMAQALPPRSHQ